MTPAAWPDYRGAAIALWSIPWGHPIPQPWIRVRGREPGGADLGWDEPLPDVITLAPDYGAELPLWGNGFGNIAWQYTRFSPALLDQGSGVFRDCPFVS